MSYLHTPLSYILSYVLISFASVAVDYLPGIYSLSGHAVFARIFVGLMMVVVALSLVYRAHQVRRREAALRECASLARSCDQTVRQQLRSLEQGMAALEGHELVLAELGSRGDDVASQVERLRQAYRHLQDGSYCDRPALDSVLRAGVRRLQALGVVPKVTVAGVPAQAVVPATITLTLLNLAYEAAERSSGVQDAMVELRIRGMGEQVFFHLEVPNRWGALWARRYLRAFEAQGASLVRERRQGDRRAVLVLSGGSQG